MAATKQSRRLRGQGLVEFALTLPVLMLILLIAVDAGRLFYAYVGVHNAARIGANFAATHADAWPASSSDRADYAAQMDRETSGLNCDDSVIDPVFSPAGAPPRSAGDGHIATVTVQCLFHPLTPLIGAVLGDVQLTATDSFPIRSGMLNGFPMATGAVPTPSPTPSPIPTVTPTATPGPSASPGPTPTPTLAPFECRVPTILGQTVDRVVAAWNAAGFKPAKLNVEVGTPNYIVRREYRGNTNSTWDGTVQNCNSFDLSVGP